MAMHHHQPECHSEISTCYVQCQSHNHFYQILKNTETFALIIWLVSRYIITRQGKTPWPCCFTSTKVRLLIRDGDRGGRGWESEGSTVDTAQKRPERPWTAARTMKVLRQCPLTIVQQSVHCAIAVSTAVVGRVTRTMSTALLSRNNPKRKKSNFRSPAPPPCSWSLLG